MEAVFISHLTFILSHIRNSSPTLLQEMHSLVFRIHNEWKWPEMNMDLDLNLATI